MLFPLPETLFPPLLGQANSYTSSQPQLCCLCLWRSSFLLARLWVSSLCSSNILRVPPIVFWPWLLLSLSSHKIINSSSHIYLVSQQLKTSLNIVCAQRNAEVRPYWTRLYSNEDEHRTETDYLPQPFQASSFSQQLPPSTVWCTSCLFFFYAFTYFFYTQILYTDDTIFYYSFATSSFPL